MESNSNLTGTTIHEEPIEIGGHTVVSYIATGYEGPCAVRDEVQTEELICAFPNASEANRAARYATTQDGGYGSVIITPCSADHITHAKFVDWVF